LTGIRAVSNLSYNYVAHAIRADGSRVVLKLGVPNPELTSEIAALRACRGRGAVRLLEADPDAGMLLMERLSPGTLLTTLVDDDDDRASRIAAEVMAQIWCDAPSGDHAFITTEQWSRALPRIRKKYEGGTGPFPRKLFEQAERWFADLLPSQTKRVVLHGDLHHENILLSARGWLAIDPKGAIGEPEYEPGALLRNPLDLPSRPNPVKLTERRIAILCEQLDLDRKRVLGWAIAQAVLSACWDVEDDVGSADYDIACAEIYCRTKI
jgi:streptomycin 6-kinase